MLIRVLFFLSMTIATTGWSKGDEAPFVEGEVLIKLKSQGQKHEDILAKLLQKTKVWNLKLERTVKTLSGNIYVVKSLSKSSGSLKDILSSLRNSPDIEVAEPNFIYTFGNPKKEKYFPKGLSMLPVDAPSDPLFQSLWGLSNVGQSEPTKGVPGADIDALKAWEIHKGDRKIKIAVIDTGIDYNHPDLKDNIWNNEAELKGTAGIDDDNNGYVDDIYGYDFANNDSDPMDGHGHGTHCSGTIGAVHNNGIGVAGVMDEVSLVAIKFLSDTGSGTTEAAILAIDYATKLNVDIMSNSWGGGGFSQLLKESIERAKNKGIIFVAAAGNSAQNNDDRPNYPSSYEVSNIVGVAAHTIDDQLANFSSYGPRTVHLAAPGKNIVSTVRNGSYATYSGTSMSTPHVSGGLGLLLAKEGRFSHEELKERLIKTSFSTRSMKRKSISQGRLNAYNLLTDTRPVREGPNPNAWKRKVLDSAFESEHPYRDNQSLKKTLQIPGAKYMRVIVKKFDLENRYDFLTIRNANTREVGEKITGSGENYTSDYIEGDHIELEMTSDHSVNQWGFQVQEIEYIIEN